MSQKLLDGAVSLCRAESPMINSVLLGLKETWDKWLKWLFNISKQSPLLTSTCSVTWAGIPHPYPGPLQPEACSPSSSSSSYKAQHCSSGLLGPLSLLVRSGASSALFALTLPSLSSPNSVSCALPHIYNKPFPQPHLEHHVLSLFHSSGENRAQTM